MSSLDKKQQLLVIGGGVGGYTAAIRAAKAGFAVTMVESALFATAWNALSLSISGTCL